MPGEQILPSPITEPISLCHPSAYRAFIPTSAGFLGQAALGLVWWRCRNSQLGTATALGVPGAPQPAPTSTHPWRRSRDRQQHLPSGTPHTYTQTITWGNPDPGMIFDKFASTKVNGYPSCSFLRLAFTSQMSVFFLLSYSWTLLFLGSTGEQLQQWENGKNNTNPAYSSWHWQPECCLVWQRAETLTGLIPKQVSTICTWTASKHSLC